ncbi:MAG TPA: hypothetical protein VGJ05_09765 [Fimbriiglobus sp.]
MAKKRSVDKAKRANRYGAILTHIFERYYTRGTASFEFPRSALNDAAKSMNVVLPKNLGDLLYSFRFRTGMPESIQRTAKDGYSWTIELFGRANYRMRQRKINRIVPNESMVWIKIPDATPEIVAAHALSDEQALLAKVRYNRLIDIFLRVTAYSLQSHLRTTVREMGQIETDELYIAVTNTGQQFVIPVQAKGGKDQIGVVQVEQDLALCRDKYPDLIPRPVAVQFIRDERGETIVMIELTEKDGEILMCDEKHYRLVPASEIGPEDIQLK